MSNEEKINACLLYFNELADELNETHELVKSCNNDLSMYLIPKGSIDQLTYHSKPVNSYRFSDHWNWYSSTSKCKDERYVQCFCPDMPWAKRRLAEGKASRPAFGICVAFFGDDNKYHHVFGDKFNRKTHEWSFV